MRKAAKAWRIESAWFVSKTPAVRQSPATNKGMLLGEWACILSPFYIKGGNWKPQTWQDSLETCKDSLCLCLLQKWVDCALTNPSLTKKRLQGKKRENVYKENKRVVFLFLAVTAKGRLSGDWTQWERMCWNFAIKNHWKRATRWVPGWREGAWQPHQMQRCWETSCIHKTSPLERPRPHCAGEG